MRKAPALLHCSLKVGSDTMEQDLEDVVPPEQQRTAGIDESKTISPLQKR